MGSFLSRRKFAWCLATGGAWGSARGPLLPVETLAAQNVAGQTLVKAEAAGGGGGRPAFTRVGPATTIGGRGRWAEITPICRLIFRPHAREDEGRRSSTRVRTKAVARRRAERLRRGAHGRARPLGWIFD